MWIRAKILHGAPDASVQLGLKQAVIEHSLRSLHPRLCSALTIVLHVVCNNNFCITSQPCVSFLKFFVKEYKGTCTGIEGNLQGNTKLL